MVSEKIPDWLTIYMRKITSLNVYPASNPVNHALVNEYLSGQGIMPHTDGPLFFPTITTISCGSHTVLELQKDHTDIEPSKLLLEARSLLILKDDLYHNYLHSIKEVDSDTVEEFVNLHNCSRGYNVGDILQRQTRLSVTIRNVPKVLKLKLF